LKVILVTHFEPEPAGHGGNHRTYQIHHDLEQVVGTKNVVVVSLPAWNRSRSALSVSNLDQSRQSTHQIARSVARKIAPLRVAVRSWRKSRVRERTRKLVDRLPFLLVEDPVDLLVRADVVPEYFSEHNFIGFYEQVARTFDRPAVCIIEHPGFAGLLPVNSRYGIPTICCPQNVESFDAVAPLWRRQTRDTYLSALQFAREFIVLAKCDAYLPISKVEAGLLGGLGLSVRYYPYLPTGSIRKNLERIRRARLHGAVDRSLFVMLGSAVHPTTWESFSWLVENARRNGLPDNVRIVIGGLGTEALLGSEARVPGLEVTGWLEQHDLDRLLSHAGALLAPQATGFGALTRLSEMSCAGIPAIVSTHATYAVDPPPGLHAVDDDWSLWRTKMEQLADGRSDFPHEGYLAWEARQPRPLAHVLSELANGSERDSGTSR
jgi:hypothetical protein